MGNLSGHAAVNKLWEFPTPDLSGRMTPQVILPKKVIEVKNLEKADGTGKVYEPEDLAVFFVGHWPFASAGFDPQYKKPLYNKRQSKKADIYLFVFLRYRKLLRRKKK